MDCKHVQHEKKIECLYAKLILALTDENDPLENIKNINKGLAIFYNLTEKKLK